LIRWDESCYGTLLVVPCLLRENNVYKKCVEQRQRENIVFKLDDFEIREHTFIECFKREPKGAMCPSIFELCCHLFSHEYLDTIILSQSSVNELLEGHRTQYLEKDLTEERVDKADQIFAPIVDSLHWSLVAVSTKQKNFILDSGLIGGELINRTSNSGKHCVT
jgi:hypothetical protein